MPLYEYSCQDCGHHFDLLRCMQEADVSPRCDHCQGSNTKRQLSTFFAHTAGGGETHSAAASGGCGGCSGGSCGSCHH